MGFSNEAIGGINLVREAIQSPNFIPGVSGWAVMINGSAEFNNVVIRGQIFATLTVATMPAMANGWSVGGTAKYALDVLGNLIVSWSDLTPGTVADGTAIWAAGSLPAAFRPAAAKRINAYTDALKVSGFTAEGCALLIGTDGSVECIGVSTSATRVDLFAIVPLTF